MAKSYAIATLEGAPPFAPVPYWSIGDRCSIPEFAASGTVTSVWPDPRWADQFMVTVRWIGNDFYRFNVHREEELVRGACAPGD